jgi:hypothetical protein
MGTGVTPPQCHQNNDVFMLLASLGPATNGAHTNLEQYKVEFLNNALLVVYKNSDN